MSASASFMVPTPMTVPAAPAAVPAKMDRRLLYLLTLTCVLTTGNVYYAQPLLGRIAAELHSAPGSVGFIPTLSQLGYVAGLIFLTPLGDVLEKKKLLLALLCAASLGLFSFAMAPTLPLLMGAAFFIGLTSVLVQILIPFVAILSSHEERGRNLGVLLGGALMGILLSRTLSGFIGEHAGWRAVFFIAGGVMILLALTLSLALPKHEPETQLPYHLLLHSVWVLFRKIPNVRAIALNGALCYGALSVFWASLAFFLQGPHFHKGPAVTGAFGLVGALGVLAANASGRYSERIGSRKLVQICIAMMIVAFLIFMVFGTWFSGLVVGVIVLDVFAQAATVSNQTQLYTLGSDAKTRLNTIYKMFYFGGGALGSSCSAYAWQHFGWTGVCAVGLVFLLAAFGWEQVSPLSPRMLAAAAAIVEKPA